MEIEEFDYIVIGGGSGGYAAARTAREVLDKVAIIDSADELGGLCILRGCMPSKTLIYSAEVLHLAQQGKKFGLQIPEARADLKALHTRKLETINEFATYRQEQLESDRFSLFRERATFLDENTVELSSGRRLRAKNFMIATGSSASTPPIRGLSKVPYWTSDEVLDLDFIPKKVVVLGGGIVACELAQFLSRIGAEVIQIQRSKSILTDFSPEASSVIEEQFREEGINLYTETTLQEISHREEAFTVRFEHAGESIEITTPHLLNALGRKPNTSGLSLGKAGVETQPTGHIACDLEQRTSNPKIWACGDVAGPHEIVHIAILQGELAARRATARASDPIDYDSLLGVVFTDPQIGTVGLSEKEIQQRGIDYLSADYPFDDHGKSILMEAKRGYVKIFADRKGRVLGAECVGKDAGELIHSLAVGVSLKATVSDLLKVHWYHPTLSEIWSYPLEDIQEELS